MKSVSVISLLLATSLFSGVSSATLIGQEISISETFISLDAPLVQTTTLFTVPGDPLTTFEARLFDINFLDGETIRISRELFDLGDPDFGVIFEGLSWGATSGEITGIDLLTSAGFGSLGIESEFTADSLSLYFGDIITSDDWFAGEFVDITLTVSHSTPGTVPSPGTLALFGIGIAGFGWLRRKTA